MNIIIFLFILPAFGGLEEGRLLLVAIENIRLAEVGEDCLGKIVNGLIDEKKINIDDLLIEAAELNCTR